MAYEGWIADLLGVKDIRLEGGSPFPTRRGLDFRGNVTLQDDPALGTTRVIIGEGATLTPPTLAANVDNYNPTGWEGADIIRLSSNTAVTITGFEADSARKMLINVGANPITIAVEDSGSIEANRVAGTADFTLQAGDTAEILYDEATQRWRVISFGGDAVLDFDTLTLTTQLVIGAAGGDENTDTDDIVVRGLGKRGVAIVTDTANEAVGHSYGDVNSPEGGKFVYQNSATVPYFDWTVNGTATARLRSTEFIPLGTVRIGNSGNRWNDLHTNAATIYGPVGVDSGVTGSRMRLNVGPASEAASDGPNSPGGLSDRFAAVSSNELQTASWNLAATGGTRGTKVKFFLTDNVSGSGAWGHWLDWSSAGSQPYVVGIGVNEVLRLGTDLSFQAWGNINRFGPSAATLGASSGTPVGTLDKYVQVGTTTGAQETGFAILSEDGTRNARAQFFLKDHVTSGSGIWGLWQTSSSGGQQPFVIGIGNTEWFRIHHTTGDITVAANATLASASPTLLVGDGAGAGVIATDCEGSATRITQIIKQDGADVFRWQITSSETLQLNHPGSGSIWSFQASGATFVPGDLTVPAILRFNNAGTGSYTTIDYNDMVLADVATDSADKFYSIHGRPYLNSQGNWRALAFIGSSGVNLLRVGGDTGNDSATLIQFFTATAADTSGTQRGSITSTGLFDWLGAAAVGGLLSFNNTGTPSGTAIGYTSANFANLTTDNTTKYYAITGSAYVNAHGSWRAIVLSGGNGQNTLMVGGEGTLDGATRIDFFASPAVNTASTLQGRITDGQFDWYGTLSAAKTPITSQGDASFNVGTSSTTHLLTAGSGVNRTATLPAASGNAGLRHVFRLVSVGAGGQFSIAPNGAELLDGSNTAIPLMIVADTLEVACDGTSWYTVRDGRIPHQCLVRRNAAQSIANATYTSISWDTEDFDNGGLFAPTSTNITIRRSGRYQINLIVSVSNMDDGEHVVGSILVNGTRHVSLLNLVSDPVADQILTTSVSACLELAAGDVITGQVRHDEGASQNTATTLDQQPRMSVVELR